MKRESDEAFGSSLLNKTDHWGLMTQGSHITNRNTPSTSLSSNRNGGGHSLSNGSARGNSALSAAAINRANYMCRKCKAHGRTIPVKRHKRTCPFLHCTCIKCILVDQGRKVVARQIALYRDQKGTGNSNDQGSGAPRGSDIISRKLSVLPPTTTGPILASTQQSLAAAECSVSSPHCRRCRNHNIVVTWKGHKKICPYRNCLCDPCRLINVRKDTEKTLRDMVSQKESLGQSKHDIYSYSTPSGHSVHSFMAPPPFPHSCHGPSPYYTPSGPPPLHPSNQTSSIALLSPQSPLVSSADTISSWQDPSGASLYNHLAMLSSPPSSATTSYGPTYLNRSNLEDGGSRSGQSPGLFGVTANGHQSTTAIGVTPPISGALASVLASPSGSGLGSYDPSISSSTPDFKTSLSFAHPGAGHGSVYPRYPGPPMWNGLYPTSYTNPIDHRTTAGYPNSYSSYFPGLPVPPPLPTNADNATNVSYRTLANYCY